MFLPQTSANEQAVLSASARTCDKIVDLFFEGGTLVLECLHLRFPRIAAFCQGLSAELGQPVQANAYYSPSQAVAFPLHHDTHDVFVLQLAGSKDWRIHRPVIQYPLPDMPFDRESMVAGPVVREKSLKAGDVMYLPTGWIHEAETSQDISLHLTVGVLVYTWRDDLQAVLQKVGLEQAQFRRAAGEGSPGELLQSIERLMDKGMVQDRKQERIVQASNPTAEGKFRDIRLSSTISPITWMSRRMEVPAVLTFNSTAVQLKMPEKTLRFPIKFGRLLAEVVSITEQFRVTDLKSDHSEQSRLTVVRTLVREGLLTLVRNDKD
jgi:hypothetical protein